MIDFWQIFIFEIQLTPGSYFEQLSRKSHYRRLDRQLSRNAEGPQSDAFGATHLEQQESLAKGGQVSSSHHDSVWAQ